MLKMNKIKKIFEKMPIGQKMSMLYSAVFFLIIFVVTILMVLNSWFYYGSASKSEINEVFQVIDAYISENGYINYWEINEKINNKYIDVKFFQDDKDISMFVEDISRDEFTKAHINKNIKPPIPSDERKHSFNIEMIKNLPYMVAEKEIECNNKIYAVRVFRQYSREYETMKLMYSYLLVENIIAIIVAVFIGKFITNKLLKPVRDITKTAEKISADDLSKRIEVPLADDELKSLVVTFNEMIERLEISFQRQNQFVSDASHELRTPISVIQGYANLIDRWGKEDEEILDESISSIKSETEHMSNIIKQLLFLVKSDGIQKLNLNELDIDVILEEISKEINILEVKTQFEYIVEEKTVIKADYDLIKQLLWILVDNAVKYSGNKDSEIFVRVYKENNMVYISVKDNGIGISEENIQHLFERFYRADKSRNKEIAGVGLGLSIAKRIVTKHKGNIRVESEPDKGTEFIVELPLP